MCIGSTNNTSNEDTEFDSGSEQIDADTGETCFASHYISHASYPIQPILHDWKCVGGCLLRFLGLESLKLSHRQSNTLRTNAVASTRTFSM